MKLPILCSLVLAVAPAAAGPDFSSPTPKGAELSASQGTREMLPSDDIIFGLNSATLTPTGQQQLATVAKYAKLRKDQRLVIEGYADKLGDATYNLDLSTRRAAAVRSYLEVLGVPSDRMVVAVFGESAADPAGNPLDRRVIIHASPRTSRELATNALDIKKAMAVTWTFNGTLHTEERSERRVVISKR